MVRDTIISCSAALRDLKRVAFFPENAAIDVRSSNVKNVVGIWPGQGVEFAAVLVFARILTTP